MIHSKVKTKEGFEDITAYSVKDLYNLSLPALTFKRKNRFSKEYIATNGFISLDTETSHTDAKGWIYQWAFKLCDLCIYGRTPSELIKALKHIESYYKLDNERLILAYVHNWSYDRQYLKDYLKEAFPIQSTLAIKSHKVLFDKFRSYEFRCSYLLSNNSLDGWTSKLNCHYVKYSGAVDYKEVRFQDSTLTFNDWSYQFSDVYALYNGIEQELNVGKFTLLNLPFTSTGFVRKDALKEYKKDYAKNRRAFERNQISAEVYEVLNSAFMGGYTHGNRYAKAKTINGTIKHRDFVSFYPSNIECEYYPTDKFSKWFEYDGTEEVELSEIWELCAEYCVLIEIEFEGIELRDRSITFPILSYAKAYEGRQGESGRVVKDNGRVLYYGGRFSVCVTELDLKWIHKQYKAKDYLITRVFIANKGRLPEWFLNINKDYFAKKTIYKNEVNRLKREVQTDAVKVALADAEVSLMKIKNKLNGQYGMSATRPVREKLIEQIDGSWLPKPVDVKKALNKYYNSRNNFMQYYYGVYVTAHARDRLLSALSIISADDFNNFLYCDTDSAFYISTPDVEARLEAWQRKEAVERLANNNFVEVDGKKQLFMGFELEPEDIRQFRFLHAKCYAFVTNDGALNTTVAGVSKTWREDAGKPLGLRRTNSDELENNIDNLKHGFVFRHCGGTLSKYYEQEPTIEKIDGHIIEYASSIIIEDNTKTLKDFDKEFIIDFELE